MHIVHHPRKQRIATLHKKTLRIYDISTGSAQEIAAHPVAKAHRLAACDACIGVLSGTTRPAGASLGNAVIERFSWDMVFLGSCTIEEVSKYDLSLSQDGQRFATINWQSGEVTVYDADSGQALCSNGEGIPSGASFSPDDTRIIAGSADQGSGAILLFELQGNRLSMETLPEPDPCPGLDDAPYFSTWSPHGRYAAISNETWGGRGLFVYDMHKKQPHWSIELPSSAEECEEWFAFPAAFDAYTRILWLANPGQLQAYSVLDGSLLGSIDLPNTGKEGFVVTAHHLWLPGPTPTAYPLPNGLCAPP